MQSPEIGELASALAKAQSTIKNAKKEKENPFFKSKYADLMAIWDVCRQPLSENELAVTQCPIINEKDKCVLETTLMHSSGQWIKSFIPVLTLKEGPQPWGCGLTYARRYGLAGIAGVTVEDEDDDGNEASDKTNQHYLNQKSSKPIEPPSPVSKIKVEQYKMQIETCKDIEEFKKLGATVPNEYKIALQEVINNKKDEFKKLSTKEESNST